MLGKRGLFGQLIEPPKELTEEEKKKRDEYIAKGERVEKALVEFKDDSQKGIIEILKECSLYKLEDYEPLIFNLQNPQKVST